MSAGDTGDTKDETNTMTTYTLTGNTFAAKDAIRASGFAWDGSRWTGDENAVAQLDKRRNPSYGRRDARNLEGVRVVPMHSTSLPGGAESINDLMDPADSIY